MLALLPIIIFIIMLIFANREYEKGYQEGWQDAKEYYDKKRR